MLIFLGYVLRRTNIVKQHSFTGGGSPQMPHSPCIISGTSEHLIRTIDGPESLENET